MGTEYEKDFDDEVYEDEFYKNNDGEELKDEDHLTDDNEEEGEEDWDDDNEKKIDRSFACEDCDYRWDDVIIRRKDDLHYDEEINTACPMCGSTNITQI